MAALGDARVRLVLFAVVAVALIAASLVAPVGRWAVELIEWVRGAGAGGVAVYATSYVVATVLLLPASLLTVGAGFVYGLAGGAALVVPAASAGAVLAFAIGRSVARDRVREWAAGRPRLAAVDDAVGERALLVVFLLRLSPLVPFNLLNYFLGLTRVRWRDYVLATVVGIVPGGFLYVYIGASLADLAALRGGERPDAGLPGQVLLWGGLAATAVVTLVISRLARRRLERVVERDRGDGADAQPRG